MVENLLQSAIAESVSLTSQLHALAGPLSALCDALRTCWTNRGKVLIAGNGGSSADAMHLAEELVVRFSRPRRAFAAIALLDPTTLTCAANDMGFEAVFSRQVEALGNKGDILIVLSTSGNSPNIVKAIETAAAQGLKTVSFLGKGGGQLKGRCDIELLVPSNITQRIQEAHQLLFHTLCQWVDAVADEI